MNVSEFKIKNDQVKHDIEAQLSKYVYNMCSQNESYNKDKFKITCEINKNDDKVSIKFTTHNNYFMHIDDNRIFDCNIGIPLGFMHTYDEKTQKEIIDNTNQVKIIIDVIQEDIKLIIDKANSYYDMSISEVVDWRVK